MAKFDTAFVKKVKDHDHDAFNEFYLQTVDMFFRYIQTNYFLSKEDTEDLVADFYMKRRDIVPKYNEEQSFMAYVWTVFKNLVKDHFKKSHEIPFSSMGISDDDEDFWDSIADTTDLERILEHDFAYDTILEAMKQLDDVSKDIVYWKFIEEKSHKEIEELLWLSPDNVRQKISRALKKLKLHLWIK